MVPAPPCRPGQKAVNARLRGQYEAPDEAPHLTDAQRHTNPREALKAVKLLCVEPCAGFFPPPALGGCVARSPVNNAEAPRAKVLWRYQPVQLRPA